MMRSLTLRNLHFPKQIKLKGVLPVDFLTIVAPIATLAVSVLLFLVIPNKARFPHYAISGGVIKAGYFITILGLVVWADSLFGEDLLGAKWANSVLVAAALWLLFVDLKAFPKRKLGWNYYVGLGLAGIAAGLAWYFSDAVVEGLIGTFVSVALCYVMLRCAAKKKITQYLEKAFAPAQAKVDAVSPKSAKRDEEFRKEFNANDE